MAIRINLENLNKKRKIDLSKIKKVATSSVRMLKEDKLEVNIIFVSNQKIRAMNRKYLGHDISTDVIAFPSGGLPSGGAKEMVFIGDIAISTDKALENSRSYGSSFMEEVALYVIHGILHLVGHEDTSGKKKKRMKKLENELFRKAKEKIR